MTARPTDLVEAIQDWGVEFRPYPFSSQPWYDFTTPGGWDPQGVAHHHTGGPLALCQGSTLNSSKAAMLRLLRIGRDLDGNGTPDGPLCHFAPTFMGTGKRVVYGIGFGNTNHAGMIAANVAAAIRTGTYRGAAPGPDAVDGNSILYGLEYLHPGTTALWPDELLDAGHRTAAAICEAEGWSPGAWAGSQAEHREITRRKVDRSWVGWGTGLRAAVADLAASKPTEPDGWERTPAVAESIQLLRTEGKRFHDLGFPRRARVCRTTARDLSEKFPNTTT